MELQLASAATAANRLADLDRKISAGKCLVLRNQNFAQNFAQNPLSGFRPAFWIWTAVECDKTIENQGFLARIEVLQEWWVGWGLSQDQKIVHETEPTCALMHVVAR